MWPWPGKRPGLLSQSRNQR